LYTLAMGSAFHRMGEDRFDPARALPEALAAKAAILAKSSNYAVCLVLRDGSRVGARISYDGHIFSPGHTVRGADVMDVLPDQRLVPVG